MSDAEDRKLAEERARTAVQAQLVEEARAQSAPKPEAPAEEKNFFEMLMQVIKDLFSFLFSSEGPDGPDTNTPATPTEARARVREAMEHNVPQAWGQYQAEHRGEKVLHQSPVAKTKQPTLISSGFGHRDAPTKGASTDHKGVDFAVVGNRSHPDIVASAGGVVLFAGQRGGYGNLVILGHADGSTTRYGHLTGDKMPALGTVLKAGDTLGVMGNTGTSSNPHLHYEQRGSLDGPAHAPQIAHYGTLSKGEAVEYDTARMAALVDRSAHPKVASGEGKSAPSAFVGGGKATIAVGVARKG